MAWLESTISNFSPWMYSSIITIVIAVLTVAVAWGIRPGLTYLLNHVIPAWSGWVALALQVLIILGGMAPIVMIAGINAAIVLLAAIGAILVGVILAGSIYGGGENLVADRFATLRIRTRHYYNVGDEVTLGNGVHGVVTALNRTNTQLDVPGQTPVLLRNSLIMRNLIVVHGQVVHGQLNAPSADMATQASIQAGTYQQQHVATKQGAQPPVDSTMETASGDLLVKADDGSSLTASVGSQLENQLKIVQQDNISLESSAEIASAASGTYHSDARYSDAHQADAQQTESMAQLLPAWSTTILSAEAVPLTKRTTLGKRTIRSLR